MKNHFKALYHAIKCELKKPKSTFEEIARQGGFESDGTTLSGTGSTLEINKYRVEFLGRFIRDYNIESLLDIPCGDCNWQHTIPGLESIHYFGTDISKTVLETAKAKNAQREYMQFSTSTFDLTTDIPELYRDGNKTLVLVKEVIQHLNLDRGLQAMLNVKASGAKYLAVTHHSSDLYSITKNQDIDCGEFYPNNMFLAPFNFSESIANVDTIVPKDLQKYFGNLLIFDLETWNPSSLEHTTTAFSRIKERYSQRLQSYQSQP